MTIYWSESRNALGREKRSSKKATLSTSEYPAHCPLPALMALQQREDGLLEDGGEEALTLSCALQQPSESQVSSDRAGLPKCIARCWDDRRLRYSLVSGDL